MYESGFADMPYLTRRALPCYQGGSGKVETVTSSAAKRGISSEGCRNAADDDMSADQLERERAALAEDMAGAATYKKPQPSSGAEASGRRRG